jgi:hypothetical protein
LAAMYFVTYFAIFSFGPSKLSLMHYGSGMPDKKVHHLRCSQ